MLSLIASIAFFMLVVAFCGAAIVLNYLRHKQVENADSMLKERPAPSTYEPGPAKRPSSREQTSPGAVRANAET